MDSPTFTGKRIVLRPNADEITRLSEGSISINNTSGEWLLQRQSSPRERRSTPVIRVPSTPKNVQAPTYHCDPDAGNHMAYHTPLARPPAHRYKDQNSPDRTPNGAERRLLSSMPDDDSTPPFMTASITSHHPEMDFHRPASIVITPDEGSTNNKPRVSLGEVTTMDTSSDGDAHAAGCCCCCGGAISRMWDTFKVSAKYVTADVYRRPRNTIIGFIAVLLLVFFSGVVMLAISKAPCILLRLAELTVGEMDVVFYSGGSSNPLLNFTALLPDIMGGNEVHGTSPRWIVKAGISNSNQSLSTVANLIVADTKREIQSGIGRGWPYRAIGFGEAQVFYSAAEYVDTSPEAGERVFLTVDPSNLAENVSLPEITVNRPTTVTSYPDLLLQAFFQMNNIQGDSFNAMDAITPSVYATMESAIQSSYGKYPSSLGNVVMLDSTALPSMVVSESCLLGAPSINTNPENGYYFPTPASLLGLPTEKLEDFRLADYAMMIIAIFKGRYSMYYSSSNKMQRLMVLKSNSMMFAMGIDSFNGTVQYPLVTALEAYDTFKVLLISTVVVVVVCLVFLGSILMFALLRINAEERQFELAMLRATGAPAFYLVVAFVLQTLMFAVPATFFGIGLMWIANVIIESILTNFTYAPTRAADIPVYAGLLCTFLGLVLPLVAVWGPIANALGTSLRNALDIYRQAQNESTVVMQRLEEMGLAGWQVALGVFLTVAGFMIYYMVPLAFIFQNILLFFLMMELVLLCMIVGLCMMTYVLQPLSEKVVLKALLWGGERRLEDLILKNLRSHRERNSKAYMMFLLSVACLMAAGVMFAELSQVSADMAELANGAQITLTSSSFASPINETVMDAFLSTQSKYVAAWAYSSFELTSYPQMGTNTYISSLIGKSRSVNTISVSKNFMNAVYPKFNMVQSYAKGYKYPKTSEGKMDVVKSMYDEAPHAPSVTNVIPIGTGFDSGIPIPDVSRKLTFRVPIMIAAAAKDLLGITTTSGSLISFWYRTRIPGGTNYPSTTIYAEPRALMKRVSGFFAVSSLPVLFSTGSIMMPESYFLTLLDLTRIDYEANSGVEIAYGAVLEIRQKVLYVRLHGGTSERNRIRVVNAIQAMDNSPDHTLTDTSALVAQLESVRKMIMIFFYCTAAVASILCAFMLWVTFIATVQHSAWVFGVLRSLGFTTAQLIRAAIYEALCIVISGFVIGLTVGVLVGLTMVIQLSGFMVLPFSFQVPYVLLILLLVMGVLAAVVGSSLPFWSLSSKPIAQVLRGL